MCVCFIIIRACHGGHISSLSLSLSRQSEQLLVNQYWYIPCARESKYMSTGIFFFFLFKLLFDVGINLLTLLIKA